MMICELDPAERLPDKILIICNDYSVTFDRRKKD